jgi:hypothetical protein
MSDSLYSLDEETFGSDEITVQPPRILFWLSTLSVLLGTAVGLYGVVKINSSVGYLLTIIIPIALLQLIRVRHDSALKVNEEKAYNIGGGEDLKYRATVVVGIGLACAALSITVFFWPIAQGFAK